MDPFEDIYKTKLTDKNIIKLKNMIQEHKDYLRGKIDFIILGLNMGSAYSQQGKIINLCEHQLRVLILLFDGKKSISQDCLLNKNNFVYRPQSGYVIQLRNCYLHDPFLPEFHDKEFQLFWKKLSVQFKERYLTCSVLEKNDLDLIAIKQYLQLATKKIKVI